MGKRLPERLMQIEQEWDRPGSIRLLFQDEARFGRIAQSKRYWCLRPIRPVLPHNGVSRIHLRLWCGERCEWTMGQRDITQDNSVCMQIFLEEIALRYPDERIVMVLDGASWNRLCRKI